MSSNPSGRLDVISLQEQLDAKLQQKQTRETGICPVRRDLYSQCFDELIRQVTVNCSERGTLLMKVRDEIRVTISAYQTLYESSVAFGMRKALMSVQGKIDMDEQITTLLQEKKELEQQAMELRNKCDTAVKTSSETWELEIKKFKDEIQTLKKTKSQLQAQLEGIVAPQKK